MSPISKNELLKRFDLSASADLAQRFAKAPDLIETEKIADRVYVSMPGLTSENRDRLRVSVTSAAHHLEEWFERKDNLVYELWLADNLTSLQFMNGTRCPEGYFCAPGEKEKRNIIIAMAPWACCEPISETAYTGCLIHEMTHHITRKRADASVHTMRRQQESDLPMWLEEGICQLIQSLYDSAFRERLGKKLRSGHSWDDIGLLWNDLSAARDTGKAYLQAFFATWLLSEVRGKDYLLKLLDDHSARSIDWGDYNDRVNKLIRSPLNRN